MEIQSLIVSGMELVGTIAFAASGAMVGIHCRMDVFGVCVLGVITAVGGGMTRDIILGNVPGALTNPVYVAAAVVTALVLFAVLYFKVNVLQGRIGIVYDKVMLVMDSTGHIYGGRRDHRNKRGVYRGHFFADGSRYLDRCGRRTFARCDGGAAALYFCKTCIRLCFGDGGGVLCVGL